MTDTEVVRTVGSDDVSTFDEIMWEVTSSFAVNVLTGTLDKIESVVSSVVDWAKLEIDVGLISIVVESCVVFSV